MYGSLDLYGGKKPDKKQKKAEASKNTLQLLPERYYDDELDAFVIENDMTGYRYMDLIEIKSQDLNNLSEDEVYFNMAKLSRFFKRYEIDIKLIALNFPSDMSKQKKYYMKKRESTKMPDIRNGSTGRLSSLNGWN